MKHVSAEMRAEHDHLWADREALYAMIERLPQVFSHFDLSRGNLLTRRGEDGQKELVAIDWAQCGLGPLGAELTNLVGMSALSLAWSADELRQLDALVFTNYLKGLREAGWSGEAEMARLGYVAWLAVCVGFMMPGTLASSSSGESRPYMLAKYGMAEEELFWHLIPVFRYTLDCADEARRLAAKLGI
jgi:aminoglycoside/choline kinase family phosphotransferase